jgi:hypothetical protein
MAKRKRKGQTIPWPREKEKDRQYHGQEKKRRTDNTMANRKREGQTIPWPREKEKDNQVSGNIFGGVMDKGVICFNREHGKGGATSNTMVATSVAGSAVPSGAPEFTP